ncbi:hypothetical protein [Pseudomonas sp.]|uniref:hypothetical protein n=1 Tax=Pseudomonas sp. TaxID=306 RepID=UPI0028AF1F2A|nr:hypothetical protein [Pseudomonas sp.]
MTAIKERPILFSAPMVRAILEGRKTVTRRPVKGLGLQWLEDFTPEYVAEAANSLCPYGKPGDRLWVRETWYCNHSEVQKGPYLQPDDMQDLDQAREDGDLVYAADGLSPYEQDQPTWRPSIHMPRWASRILLEITDLRVERLQDVTEEQAQAEGACTSAVESFQAAGVDRPAGFAFRDLWTSINGDDSWAANPWVWVVEFKRVTP